MSPTTSMRSNMSPMTSMISNMSQMISNMSPMHLSHPICQNQSSSLMYGLLLPLSSNRFSIYQIKKIVLLSCKIFWNDIMIISVLYQYLDWFLLSLPVFISFPKHFSQNCFVKATVCIYPCDKICINIKNLFSTYYSKICIYSTFQQSYFVFNVIYVI